MKTKYGFYVDEDRCIKCWACEVACKQWHGIKAGTVKYRRVVEIAEGTFPDVKRKFMSVSCAHCEEPPCMDVCPVNAIYKREEDGIVLVDPEKCIGCRACLDVCPFGAPQFGEGGVMEKCDMCLDRILEGKQPICAASCPTEALKWGLLSEHSEITAKNSIVKQAKG